MKVSGSWLFVACGGHLLEFNTMNPPLCVAIAHLFNNALAATLISLQLVTPTADSSSPRLGVPVAFKAEASRVAGERLA